MIEIELSKDIKEQDVKILGPFTARQAVCLLIAGSYGVPMMFLLPGTFLLRSVIAIVAMMPVILCGWCKVYGIPLEKFAVKVLKSFRGTKERKYVTENRFENLVEKKTISSVTRNVEGEILK